MNEISTIVDGDRMTSLQIAEITGKPHNDVMKAIRKMEPAWQKVQEGNFSLMQEEVETNNGGHKMRPYFSLNKEECLYIATKFNDEARAKLIKRWKELEEQHQKPSVPQNYLEALKSLVKAEEEKQQLALENKKQLDRIELYSLIAAKNVLNINEAAIILGMTVRGVRKNVRNRIIPCYKPNVNQLYFKKSELEEWMTQNRRKSMAELKSEAAAYCFTH